MSAPTGCLTVQQLADALGCSRATVDRWLADGRLVRHGLVEANRIGRCRYFAADSIPVVMYRRRLGGLRRVAA
jgi:excisionase family DNA binding protein